MDLGLRCSLLPLLLSVLVLSASGARRCAPQVLPDMVIDIGLAVAQGARFTDPLKVANVEDCVAACCRQLDAGGDRSCNLLVYDARTPGLQSCYLFHCPTLDSCPLTASPGVLSYSFWSDPSRPGKHDPDEEQPKPGDRSEVKTSGPAVVIRKPSSAIASQVSAEHGVKEELADSSKSIASQLLHLAEEMDQHLEKMESGGERRVPASPPAAAPSSPPAAAPSSPPAAAPSSPPAAAPASPPAAAPASPPAAAPASPPAAAPASTPAAAPALQTALAPGHREVMKLPFNAKAAKPGKAKHKKPELLPTHRPPEAAATTVPKRATPRRSTAAPRPVPRTSHVVPPAATHRVSGTKEVPGSTVSPTEVPALTTAHNTRPPHLATRPAPSWTSPRKGTKLSTKNNDRAAAGDEGKTPARLPPESYSPAREEAPRKVGGAGSAGVLPPPGDKSGLVAALIFGLLFLMAVIGLVSRKVSEARRRHRYTKLDYLINGMYVDT